MIKTFRGLIPHTGQTKVRLSTKQGKIGYQIKKFQIIGQEPGEVTQEHTVKIFKVLQSVIDNTLDFSDGNLLGCAVWKDSSGADAPIGFIQVFDKEIFNQDIFITHYDTSATNPCNYYLELEAIKLSDNATAVSTLRDIRLNPQVGT